MRFRLRTLLITLALGSLVLALFLLPPVMGSRPAPALQTLVTVSFFNEAIESYKNRVGELPRDLESLLKQPRDLPTGVEWGGPYLGYEELPLDPWRSNFQYEVVDPKAGTFRVWSKGPDRRSQTEDDIFFR